MKDNSRFVKYLVRILAICVVTALIIVFAARIRPSASEQTSFKIQYDLNLWYYDETLTPYLTSFGDDYFKTSGNRVNVELVPSLEFFDTINKRNIEGAGAPDLYIIDSSKLENAYLSSLAKPNIDPIYNTEHFSEKALAEATYKDVLAGYPLCFNTSFLVYNTSFRNQAPSTFEELLASAEDENRDAETRLLEYDVSNLLYTYFVIADQIDMGGKTGDDANAFDLSSDSYTEALTFYQSMSKSLDIDAKLIDHNTVEKNFLHGSTQMAIVSNTALTKLYGSGTPFQISRIPDLTAELSSTALSQTSIICVNPDSKNVDGACDLAKYLSYDHAEELFSSCGLMSTVKNIYDNADLTQITEIYESSASLPKLIETENIWDSLNTMLVSVWNGEDIDRAQNKLNVAVYVALSTRTEQEDR